MIAEGKEQEAAQLINKETAGTNRTTSGVVQAGKMAEFEKAIREGKSGAEFIAAPVTFQQATPTGTTGGTVTAPMATEQSPADRLAETQRQATIAGLDKARQQSMLALSEEERAVQPQFAQQRSQARATSQRGAQSFADFMARRGLGASGATALGETQRLGALQGTLGGLQQQEQDVLANIAARRTGVEQAYASDVAAAKAGLEAERLRNVMAQQEATKAQERQDFPAKIAARYNDLQAYANELMAQGAPQWQIDQVLAARQQKVMEQGLDPITGQLLPTQIALSPSQALDLWSVTGRATPEIAAALGVQQGDAYSTYAQRIKGAGTTTSTAPNQADVILGKQNLANEFTTQRFNYDTKRVEPVQLSPMEAIAKISQNYNAYVKDYTKQAVDEMISDLQAQANPQQMTDEEYLDYLQTQKKIQELETGDQPTVEDIPRDILSTLNATFIKPVTNEFGDKIGEEVDNDAMWNAVTQLYLNGNLTAQQADRLEVIYGLTEPPNYLYQGGR